ncbi:response regulator [Cohnella fermenti]|uniref:response regulator n=1 Tax=Cohnella fermenti TaxID=2565925 RepID=UPI001454DD8A|nr:response regulator [Cohnella fermenti]
MLIWIFPYYEKQSKRRQELIVGALFGIMGCVAMIFPYDMGLRLDSRLEFLFFSGVFGGPLSVFLTFLLVGSFRLTLGGYVMPGIALIASGALISLGAHWLRRRQPRVLERYAFLFGLLLGTQSILWVYLSSFKIADSYYSLYYVPYVLFHILAIPSFYHIISFAIKRIEIEKKLRISESSLLHYKEHLEELVEARTAELEAKNVLLEEAKQAAEAANQTKGEFLANMSHEIRTPLNAVIGLSYLMQRTSLNEQQKSYTDKTILSAKNLLSLINDILDFSKIEANKVALERIAFDLYEVLNQISNLVGIKAHDKGLKLSFSVHHEVPQRLTGDPFRLNQVLLNLSNNAVKFTERGEISFHVHVLDDEEDGVLLEFSVTDTGIGIPEEHRHKLFQVFSQTDMSTTRLYGGTGLGLVISKNLVELMGGTIKAESEVGKGSRFSFTARFGHAAAASALPTSAEDLPLRPLRVLVVCDDADMRLVLASQLEAFEFEVRTVDSDEAALALLHGGERFDLAIVDWKLRSGNAVRLTERMRLEAADSVQVIVLISAYHEREWDTLIRSSAIERVLHYPLSQSQLYNEMVTLFQSHFVRKQELKEPDRSERFAELKHSALLLVEDNEINQQVAVELLKETGACVDVARNGLEAVELAERKRYDAILMDLQMPFMSGYEAAAAIRNGGLSKTAPIIAMTADALKGVEEAVYQAGMNAHVVKPFDPIQLFGALQRLMQKSQARAPVPPSPAAADAAKTENEELPGLTVRDTIARLNRNRKLYLTILQTFEDQHSGGVEEIREALESGDREAALRLAHSLIGVSANIGASELTAALRRLEDAIREGRDETFRSPLPEAAAQLDLVLRSIRKLLSA